MVDNGYNPFDNEEICPDCHNIMDYESGCYICRLCGLSYCG